MGPRAGSAWRRRVAKVPPRAPKRRTPRQVSSGPEHDAGPRWSPDARTAQLHLGPSRERTDAALSPCSLDGLGEAEVLPEIEGTIEEHAWSPDGSRILVLAAGLHADSAGAEGSGALESERDLPDWTPQVDSWEDRQVWRRLWVVDVGSGDGSSALTRRSERLGSGLVRRPCRGRGGLGGSGRILVVLRSARADRRRDRRGAGDREERRAVRAPVGRAGRCSRSRRSRLRAVTANWSPAGVLIVDTDGTEDRRRRDRGRGHHLGSVACETDASPTRRSGEGTRCSATSTRRRVDRDEAVVDDRRASGAWAPYAASFGEDGFAFVRQGFDRPLEVAVVEDGARTGRSPRSVTRDTTTRGAWSGRAERVTWTAPDGLEIDGFLLAPGGRRAASPDPADPRRPGLVLSGVVPEALPLVARLAGLRDPDAEPARLDGPRVARSSRQ